MKVLITGSSGMIGTALAAALRERGDEPVGLSRSSRAEHSWDPQRGTMSPLAMAGVEAVVNLAGKRIFPPFTPGRRRQILESRVAATRLITSNVVAHRPRVFVSGSAVGFYGNRGDESLTEASGPGAGFLSEVTRAWEAETRPAADAGVRTVLVRTGLVLDHSSGLLPTLSLPFRFGVGGPIGGGRQWWSWVSLIDEVRAILHCLDSDLRGPVNLVSPGVVTNREFSTALGRHLRRPSILPLPAWAIRLVLGRLAADELVLASQKAIPAVLLESGFEFVHTDLMAALKMV